MKKILIVLLLLLSTFAFAVAYVNTDETQRTKMQGAAESLGESFTVPSDPRLADPEQTYSIMLSAAQTARVNVLRTSTGFTSDGRPQVSQYILLTGDTNVFDAFGLQRGRWLTPKDTQSTARFLSSLATNDPDEVGVLRDFGGNDLVAIRSLKTAFGSLPVAGRYVVESSDPSSSGRFFDLLAAKATQRVGASASPLSAADFRNSQDAVPHSGKGAVPILVAILCLTILLTALLLVYRLLHEAKQIGVMKLNGLGTQRVWYEVLGRLILVVLAASAAVSLLVALFVRDTTAGFMVSVLMSLAGAYVLMLLGSLLTCVYIGRIKVSDSVKIRKDTRGVFALNTVMKAICSVLLIVVGSGLWLQFSSIAGQEAKLGNWAKTKDYGVFYPKSVGNDLIELQTGQVGSSAAEVHDLYPSLNKMGSLYIDSTNYSTAMLEETDPGFIRSIQVNPNYLHAFPLRDASGQVIDVSESTSDWVVLVPAKYKAQEARILAHFQQLRTGGQGVHGAYQDEKGATGRAAPARFATQRVRIVWSADNQRVFSFSPLVFPSENNEILDPIIQVMTSANSLGLDRLNGMSGGADSALKVRLLPGGDSTATLKMLSPTLKRLALDDNLGHLVTMSEYVLQRVQDLQQQAKVVSIGAVALGVGLLALIAESLALIFDKYARKVVVRKLVGAGFMRRYREFMLIFAATWGFQLAAAVFAARKGVSVFSAPLDAKVSSESASLAIAVVIILVELVFSITVLILIERRSLARVLKGEF